MSCSVFEQLIVLICLLSLVGAQSPPRPTNTTRVQSQTQKGVWIDYKLVSFCETTEGTRSYAGYVHLPPMFLSKYGISQPLEQNIFFWFFESRTNATIDPLTVYLNGGPGAASTRAVFREHGPCKVDADSASTRLNPWSWNGRSNMLYVDQPGNAGFSYDIPRNATFSLQEPRIIFDTHKFSSSDQIPGVSFGTVGAGSNDIDNAINSTESVTRLLWEFLQIWLTDFPEYASSEIEKLNIWTSSYGGHYGPALARYTLEQNNQPETLAFNRRSIHIDTLGLTNTCIDIAVQLPFYPEMAFWNTYDIKLINRSAYNTAIQSLDGPQGCLAKLQKCRQTIQRPDFGHDPVTNRVCRDANHYCGKRVAGIISKSGRNIFDIAYPSEILTDPLISTNLGYSRQAWVQQALGSPVNYSINADAVTHAFARTGDNAKGGSMEALAELLDSGVKVAMVYGDRDFACNYDVTDNGSTRVKGLGGEAVSVSIEHQYQRAFQSAGYQTMMKDGSPLTAHVRQHGNLSFIRVLDAAHGVAANQPEIAYELFNRANEGLDITTGSVQTTSFQSPESVIYTTTGPNSTRGIRNVSPSIPPAVCYTLNLGQCTTEQRHAFLTGKGKVEDFFLVNYGNGTCSQNPIRPCGNITKPWADIEFSLLDHAFILAIAILSAISSITFFWLKAWVIPGLTRPSNRVATKCLKKCAPMHVQDQECCLEPWNV